MDNMNSAVGIVAEYNPFHSGHLYHISETKRLLGDNITVIAALSGDFVQRGEPALFSKFDRARAACAAGADIVVEIPLAHSLSSAEFFAGSAMFVLNSLAVSYLSFGAECDNIQTIKAAAECIEDPGFRDAIRDLQKSRNISYASARETLLADIDASYRDIVSKPNNILAIEYIKAMDINSYNITPVLIRRSGNPHDKNISEGFKSASYLRELILRGEDATNYIPSAAAEYYRNAIASGKGPVSVDRIEQAVLSRLRSSDFCFSDVPDIGGGLERHLAKAVKESGSLYGIYSSAATKGYTNSKIRRSVMNAALGITDSDLKAVPEYIRLLAADKKGIDYIKINSDKFTLPVLSRGSDIKKLSLSAQKQFKAASDAHDLYVLGYTDPPERICGNDYRYSVIPQT